jgi:hypothetical protein
MVLDIHPEPDHARIHVRVGQDTYEVGSMDDTAYIRDIRAGRAVIASLIREGLFAREHEVVFEQILHATDVDTWLAYREEAASRSILDPRIVGRARDLLSDTIGEILVVNRGYGCRLRRLGGEQWI